MLSIFASAASWAPPAEVKQAAEKSHWAVLIAGSSGYGNYRHQSDVCHAYQIMKKNGIAEDKIIVLAVDDIANSNSNPYPGQVFNKPTANGVAGVDVYSGCKIDYSGSMVTPDTFVKVLTGDSAGLNSGKVLKSTKKDRVFVNFVDHGGVNIIGFPRTTMHAKELVGALTTMSTQNMYKELVFYLEACESGSMFPAGTLQPGMYATTAANAKESSYGTYCSPDDEVNGKKIGSCLGDLYSVNWMQDSDKASRGETLEKQFQNVKKLTTKSHVLEFGDTSIAAEPLVDFQGDSAAAPSVTEDAALLLRSSMDARDAEVASAYQRYMATGSAAAADELTGYVQDRKIADARFQAIVAAAGVNGILEQATPDQIDFECHYAAHSMYVSSCGDWSTGALKHSATLAKLCAATSTASVRAAIAAACPK